MLLRHAQPMPYERFAQRVRRHARTPLLRKIAAINAQFERARFGRDVRPRAPEFVTPFALAGIARTAIVAGNEHRPPEVSDSDIREMCFLYANVEEPAPDETDDTLQWTRGAMSRAAYEQFDQQFSMMENIGRTLALLADHSHHAEHAPSHEDWLATLGVSLEQFMRLGIAMSTAALSNDGRISLDVLRAPHVAPIFAPMAPEDALCILDKWFAAPLTELADIGRDNQVPGLEKWSLSPLRARPIVRLDDGYIMPWPYLILDHFTPTGLYFIGFEQFGKGYPDALGPMFEQYVGTQLRLLRHATVLPEISFGKPEQRTVDYFVATDEVVLLVEVKAARPTQAYRFGLPSSDSDLDKKIGGAIRQVDQSAKLLSERHPALSAIPTDRPLRGLVVTAEPFHLVNTFLFDPVLPDVRIPTTVVSSHELESFVASARNCRDLGARVLASLTPAEDHVPTSLDSAVRSPRRSESGLGGRLGAVVLSVERALRRLRDRAYPICGPRYASRSAHAWTIWSGTASNLRGFNCITYSFSMWYDSLTNFLKAALPLEASGSSAIAMRKIWTFS